MSFKGNIEKSNVEGVSSGLCVLKNLSWVVYCSLLILVYILNAMYTSS